MVDTVGTGMPEFRVKESSVGFWRWDEVDRDGKSIANGGTRYRTEAAAKAAYEEAKQVRAEIGGNITRFTGKVDAFEVHRVYAAGYAESQKGVLLFSVLSLIVGAAGTTLALHFLDLI